MFVHSYFPVVYFPNTYFPGVITSGALIVALEHQTTVKSWFQAGDAPTQAQFSSWIESSMPEWQVDAAIQVGGGAVGFLDILSAVSATTHVAGAVGLQLFQSATTAAVAGIMNVTPASAGVIDFQLGIVGSTTRSVNRKGSDVYSVRDFGAVGNGTTDDTAAFKLAFTAVQTTAAALYIPGGIYRLEGQVSASGNVYAYGDGVGTTLLRWSSSASSDGFHCVGRHNHDYHHFRDMSLMTAKSSAAGTAIKLDYTSQVVVSGSTAGQDRFIFDRDSPRFTVENVFFSGGSAAQFNSGWGTGIESIAGIKGNVRNCSFTGWIQGSAAGNDSSYAGSNYAIRHHGVGNSYQNGHPVEFLVQDCSFYYYINGVSFEQIEGGFIEGCNFVGCGYGALFFGPGSGSSFAAPQFNVQDCHFNVSNVGVWGRNVGEALITGTTFYNTPTALTNTIGVYLQGFDVTAHSCNVNGNTFAMTTGSPLAVLCEKLIDSGIDNNRFEFASTGISLDGNTRNVRVGAMNTFQSGVTTRYVNTGVGNFIGIEVSAANPGHADFENGIQMRWGQAVVSAGGESTVLFTRPFTNAAFMVSLTNGDNTSGREDMVMSVGIVNQTGFTTRTVNATSGVTEAGVGILCNYVAYGN